MFQGFQPLFFGILVWISLTVFFVLIETLFPKIVREGKDIAEDANAGPVASSQFHVSGFEHF